jgi:hypothetical protein
VLAASGVLSVLVVVAASDVQWCEGGEREGERDRALLSVVRPSVRLRTRTRVAATTSLPGVAGLKWISRVFVLDAAGPWRQPNNLLVPSDLSYTEHC